MLSSLSANTIGPACGLLAILFVYVVRIWRQRVLTMKLPTALLVFLGGSLIPATDMFLSYPFLDPKPDLTQHILYLPIAGLGLLWTVFSSIKQGIDDASSAVR